jgi:penicillin-binding protein 2
MDISSRSISLKIRHICTCLISISIIICCRLIYLQVIKQHLLYIQSQKNFQRIEKIRSPRGNILDVNGILLATNRPTTDLYWHGTGNHTVSHEQLDVLERITEITAKDFYNDPDLWPSLMQAERYSKDLLLMRDLSFEQLSQLEEQLAAQKNVRIATTFIRHYPHQKTACHAIGYLGSMDVAALGKMGLEKICEDVLKGLDGTKIRTINSFGTSMAETEMSKGLAGKNIYTTIDFELQKIAENIFPAEQAGVMILMDPQDGSIRALISRPDFDPTFFLHRFTQEEWTNMQDKKPFLNRAFNACYPPGSIFKIVTMSAALEQGIVSPDAVSFCPGYYMYANRKWGCSLHTGHGTLTSCESLTHSCNVLFFEIGRRINVDLIADYANRFGLGQKTGTVFNEKAGLIPNRAWKKKVKRERWWTGDTLSLAIGQSYSLVTPIQIACMIGSIFTRTLVKPRIIVEEPICKKPLDIKPETLAFIKRSMRDVIIHGTGRRVGKLNGFDIYGKTSTAQVGALAKEDLGNEFLPHAWFASYFKYQDQAPLVMIILMENAGSSRVPTGLAKNFLLAYRDHIEGSHHAKEENATEMCEELAIKNTNETISEQPLEINKPLESDTAIHKTCTER